MQPYSLTSDIQSFLLFKELHFFAKWKHTLLCVVSP